MRGLSSRARARREARARGHQSQTPIARPWASWSGTPQGAHNPGTNSWWLTAKAGASNARKVPLQLLRVCHRVGSVRLQAAPTDIGGPTPRPAERRIRTWRPRRSARGIAGPCGTGAQHVKGFSRSPTSRTSSAVWHIQLSGLAGRLSPVPPRNGPARRVMSAESSMAAKRLRSLGLSLHSPVRSSMVSTLRFRRVFARR